MVVKTVSYYLCAFGELPCVDLGCKGSDRLYMGQLSIVAEFAALYLWIVALAGGVMLSEKVDLWDPLERAEKAAVHKGAGSIMMSV